MDKKIKDNVIFVGFNNKTIHILCTSLGLELIPDPIEVDLHPGGSGYYGAYIEVNNVNLIALRMMELLSEKDLSSIMKNMKENGRNETINLSNKPSKMKNKL